MTLSQGLRTQLETIGDKALQVGLVVLGLCILFGFWFHQAFMQAYLQSYIIWIGLSGGSLAFLMIHHLAGGGWGFVSRRIFEAATKTFPLMALLILPIVLFLPTLYEWSRPDAVAASPLLQHKSIYLSGRGFDMRLLIYFAVWITLSTLLCKWSQQQDETGDPMLNKKLRVLSGGGLVLYGLTVTLASWDWTMSLSPEWFSSMWGPLFFVGQGLSTLCFTIFLLGWLSKRKPMSDIITPRHFHDLGNLAFAFVILWTYMTFAQFLIIWSGNLPEEITWYLARSSTGWQLVAVFLTIFHFVLPFLLLLSRYAKLKAEFLTRIVVFIFAVRFVDMLWVVAPTFTHTFRVTPFDLLLPIGMGGVWLWAFLRHLTRRPLIALHDPRFTDTLPSFSSGVQQHG